LVTSTVGASSARWPSCTRDGAHAAAAALHGEVVAARQDVDGVHVHEAAVVVAHVDDDAVLRVVLLVEVEDELLERALRHGRDVHVAEAAAADAVDIRAPALDPVAVAELALGATRRRAHLDVPRRTRAATHAQHYLPVRLVAQQQVKVRAAVQCDTVDGDDLVTDGDAFRDVCAARAPCRLRR
jgi:hypothetical protein